MSINRYDLNIKIFYLLTFFAWLSFWIPIYVLFYQSVGLSYTQILLITSVRSLTTIILTIPTGIFADFFQRKTSIIIAIALQVLGFVVIYLSRSFPALILGNILVGGYFAFMTGPDVAIIYESLRQNGKEKQFKVTQLIISGISIFALAVASFIGAEVAELGGFRLVILFNIAAYVVALALSLLLKEPHKVKDLGTPSIYLHLKDSLKVLVKNTNLFGISIVLAIFALSADVSQNLIQPYLKQTGLDIRYFGVVNASFLLVAGASSFLIIHYTRNHKSIRKQIVLSAIFISLQFLLLSLFVNTAVAVIAVCVGQICKGTSTVLIKDYTNKHTDDKKRATVFSMQGFIVSALSALITPFFGVISDKYNSIQISYFSLALFVLLGSLGVGLILQRKHVKGMYHKTLARIF